jgi:hypothetical protein
MKLAEGAMESWIQPEYGQNRQQQPNGGRFWHSARLNLDQIYRYRKCSVQQIAHERACERVVFADVPRTERGSFCSNGPNKPKLYAQEKRLSGA